MCCSRGKKKSVKGRKSSTSTRTQQQNTRTRTATANTTRTRTATAATETTKTAVHRPKSSKSSKKKSTSSSNTKSNNSDVHQPTRQTASPTAMHSPTTTAAQTKQRMKTLKTTEAVADPNVAEGMMEFIDHTVDLGIEGLKKEFERIGPPKHQTSTAFKEHTLKNRYSNIPCFDKTRVVLDYRVPPEPDYIHANRVTSHAVAMKTTFICTQAPTDKTIDDFWRMVWQEKPTFIVMLCRLLENKKPKCALYWPEREGESKTYGSITVTNEGDGGKGNEAVFDIEKFRVEAKGEEPIEVRHIRWLDWPDFGIPTTGLGMLRLLRKIDRGSAIVHCSAGIGRTGTVLAAEILMKALMTGTRIKVPDVVKSLRDQRFGLVQTHSQYIYLHFSICTYCERKLENYPEARGHLARLKEFTQAYKKFAMTEEAVDRKLAAQGFNTRQQTAKKQ